MSSGLQSLDKKVDKNGDCDAIPHAITAAASLVNVKLASRAHSLFFEAILNEVKLTFTSRDRSSVRKMCERTRA
jgi:hypothetical protein